MLSSRSFVLLIAAWALMRVPPPAPICAVPRNATTRGAYLFLEAIKPPANDTAVSARLCLVPPKAGVGSYHATLTFDSTLMRAVRVDVNGGMQAKNMSVPGAIKLAGAAPSGFSRGPLATIVFRPLKGKSLAKIRLTLVELNAASGADLLDGATVAGFPSTDRTLGVIQANSIGSAVDGTRTLPATSLGGPHLDSISPSSGKIDPESVAEVALYGRGFSASENTVLFDAATVDRPVPQNGGTVLKFIIPTMIPAHGNVQRHRVEAGTFMVRVRTPAGTSNAVRFTVRGEDR